MRNIASKVQQWLAAGESVAIARIVEIEGFGSRRGGEAFALNGANSAGQLLGGTADVVLRDAAANLDHGAIVVRVEIGDPVAVEAGLACGGAAVVLVQDAHSVPPPFWTAIGNRRPAALATVIASGASLAIVDGATVGSLANPGLEALAVGRGAEMLVKGRSGSQVHEGLLIEVIVPIPHLLVLGTAELAGALRRQGELLGWTVAVHDERVAGVTETAISLAEASGPQDAIVALSHDLAASCAVLAAGLRSGAYVGALGSRGTQTKRAEVLASVHGLSESAIAVVHGPVGLDLGARSPEETALAIFAEVLSHRSGRSAASLRAGAGPING